jgi:hypothetical protein
MGASRPSVLVLPQLIVAADAAAGDCVEAPPVPAAAKASAAAGSAKTHFFIQFPPRLVPRA